MAYVITDLNDFEISISDGFVDFIVWKQNIRFGVISGNILPIYWHNKAEVDTRYVRNINYNDVSSPAVASAAALQTAIEGMISSGWTPTPQDEYFTLVFGSLNEAGADNQLYLIGGRFAAGSGTSANAALKVVVPVDCTVIGASFANRTANFFSGEDTVFALRTYDTSNVFVASHALHTGPINGAGGFQTMEWYERGLSIDLDQNQGLLVSFICTAWATNPSAMDTNIILFCKTR